MYGIYLSASGAQAYDNYLNVVANNIANTDTPGFKKELAIIQAVDAKAIQDGAAIRGSGSRNDVGGGVQVYETHTQFDHGKVKSTGQPTDMMLADARGDAFFMIENAGRQMLTRAGNFQINHEGRLQTQNGDPLLSADGNEIRLDPRFPFTVNKQGILHQKRTGLQTAIAIVRPENLAELKREGSNLFSTQRQVTALNHAERNVRQGFLELSSTRPTEEMMNLIQVQRAYEANTRMIQSQDSTYGSLIGRVLQG